ncbi:hypothetical protein L211DRAFT_834991 [Terfezia boudieri ATCC MYA-4762]|uniref:Rhodopsin domain-containing protein n=1 Tax=Terfezia boudieri ATCC MYA-4762 TaxID=1051890 RepID=A0A3N4LUV7_9PEZI|nr:hypothetical protein L211DRAFT_834991 [Terfezia boudieri ATCC MYA-4762]
MASLALSGIIALAWSLYTVASIFVALRLWLRVKRNSQKLNVSDGFMMLCWFANAVACIAITYWGLIHLKYGKYELVDTDFLEKIPGSEQKYALKACVIAAFAYYVCLWSLKLSLLCQYFNFYNHLKRYLRLVLSCSITVTASLFVTVIVLNMTKCLPFERNWTILPTEQFCVSFMQKDVFLASTVANVLTDVLILALPFFILYTVPHQINKASERFAMAIVFLLGSASLSFSIIRYIRVDETTEWKPKNFRMTEVSIWTICELQIAMIAGCLPSLRVLLRDKRNSRAMSTSTTSTKYLNEKVDTHTSIGSSLKSNYTYAANSYPILPPSESWTFTQKDRIDSFGYPLAPNTAKSQMFYGYEGIYSPANTADNRTSSHYSAYYGAMNTRDSRAYEMHNNRVTLAAEYTATIAQLPTAYTPPQKFGHSRNLSVMSDDSTNSTATSEEVMITMALSPGLPRRGPSYYRRFVGH